MILLMYSSCALCKYDTFQKQHLVLNCFCKNITNIWDFVFHFCKGYPTNPYKIVLRIFLFTGWHTAALLRFVQSFCSIWSQIGH